MRDREKGRKNSRRYRERNKDQIYLRKSAKLIEWRLKRLELRMLPLAERRIVK